MLSFSTAETRDRKEWQKGILGVLGVFAVKDDVFREMMAANGCGLLDRIRTR